MIIKGEVIKGLSLGRKLGFPTANIAIEQDLDIENGVYQSIAKILGVRYRAISNIGTKPTIGADVRGLECHILDFDCDIYGQSIEIELVQRLRAEMHFDSLEELRAQIELDIERVKNLKID